MRDKLFLIVLFFVSVFLFSQNDKKYLDSVQQVIKNAKTDYKKARNLLLLSDYWAYRDTAKAFEQIRLAQKYIKNDASLKGLSLVYKAGIIYDTDIKKSQKLYLEADEILKKIHTKEVYSDRAVLWHNYAALEKFKGNDKNFVNIIIQKCIPLVEKIGKKNMLGSYQTDIGLGLTDIEDFKGAEEYFLKAIKTLKSADNNTDPLAWTYLNIASLYLTTGKNNKAKLFLDETDKLIKNKHESQYTTLYYQYLGQYYTQTNQHELALKILNKGIALAKKLNITFDLENMNLQKFQILKKQNKLEEAHEIISEILENSSYDNINSKLIVLKEMSELEHQMGNHQSAYKRLQEYQKLHDSIDDSKRIQNIQELEAKYKSAEKEKQILITKNKNYQQRFIFISVAILLLGILAFAIYALFQRKKRTQQEISILKQKKEIEISQALLKGEELERNRVAKELHDGLGGRITGLKMKLETVNVNQESQILRDATSQLQTVLNELRQTSKNLMPETLLQSGLEKALKDFLLGMENENLKISFQSNNLNEIADKNQQLNIFRIVQELVTNSIRHGKSSEILVQISKEKNLLLIDVEDNGIGFEQDKIQRNLGLNNIEMRVKSLNGTIKTNSKLGEGTETSITCKL